MPFLFKRLVLILSITAAFAADKEQAVFRPDAAPRYAHHQTNDKVTIVILCNRTDLDPEKLSLQTFRALTR